MKFALYCFILIFATASYSFCQEFSGQIINKKTGQVVEYVNIGVIGQNIGTVSDGTGKFTLQLDSQFDNDTIRVSRIGFYPFSAKVADFKKFQSQNIYLYERVFELDAITVHHKTYKHKVLGVTAKTTRIIAGFKDNILGYELGILMKIRKSARLEEININFGRCTYDSIFYRVNVYEMKGKMKFENILNEPIYLKLAKENIGKTVVLDLKSYNIVTQGNILITLEHIRNLGSGFLYFSSSITGRTYFRKTSEGKWDSAPVGISISLKAQVEQ
jgi:hypothetical protein